MTRILLRHALSALAAFAFVAAPTASGQIYKCTDASGKTTYGDSACDAAAKPLTLPADTKGNATNPSMCAQLLDETRRLDAEAERDAKRGRTEKADHAKQRQTMSARYAERCSGISRSSSPGKAKF